MMMIIIQTVIETGTGGDDLLLLLLLLDQLLLMLKEQDVTVGKVLVMRWVIGCEFRYPVICSTAGALMLMLVASSVEGQIER